MANLINANQRLIISIRGTLYGIPIGEVRGMVSVPEKLTDLPGLPPSIRGVMQQWGKMYPLMDLRSRLGLPTTDADAQALIQDLQDREAEHHYWLDELLASVEEGRPFTLPTDPHDCAFGQWFDSYKAPSAVIHAIIERFDRPHKKLHALAAQVETLVAAGLNQDAQKRIKLARKRELRDMLNLFQAVYAALTTHRREVAVVIELEEAGFAVVVDQVLHVGEIIPGGEKASTQNDELTELCTLSDGRVVQSIFVDELFRPLAGVY